MRHGSETYDSITKYNNTATGNPREIGRNVKQQQYVYGINYYDLWLSCTLEMYLLIVLNRGNAHHTHTHRPWGTF